MTLDAAHNDIACRTPKHQRVQHLITADENSLVDLELVLATLPLCSTGRVFVEVSSTSQIADLSVPPRMVLTWLDRSTRSGEPGTSRSCAAGSALSRAVTAWADEMLCDEDDRTKIVLLGGYLGTADIFDHLTEARGISPEAITTPEQFHLTPTR